MSSQTSRDMWPKAALAGLAVLFVSIGPGQMARAGEPVKLVALGDSITAGLGLKPAEAYPHLLEAALLAKGFKVEVSNAGVSGDTASDGLERLDWSVPEGTNGVILALGANDMLRGIDPKITGAALETIVARLQARHIAVLVVGMKSVSNLGEPYRAAFDRLFPDLAAAHGVDLYPFLLQDVVRHPDLNQNDGLHPNAKGAAIIAVGMLPSIEHLIERLGKP